MRGCGKMLVSHGGKKGEHVEYRKFGSTDWQVSAIGMGCWGIGGQWGNVDDQQALDTLQAALEAGINFYDTADAYGVPIGRSEMLVRRAF
jgi:myo-inositol catabolism protein IolS